MTQPAKVQEPSMEEILASIRRIIADDEAKPGAAEKPAAAAPPSPKVEPPPAAKPAMKSPPPAAPPAAKAAATAPKSPPPAPAPASNSQDDIDSLLASLDEATPAAEIRPSPQPEAQPEADVFELTDDMALPDPAPAAAAPSFRKVEPQDDVEFTEARSRAQEPGREQPASEPAPMQQIISGTTMRAVESAFNSLANTVLSNNARTLEDLVKEMLRPMLKSWLDDNLPGLVERIVKAEIERVSRGR
ncbi:MULTISPECIES: PopZ family protein [unclassified Bradyrhizobium]